MDKLTQTTQAPAPGSIIEDLDLLHCRARYETLVQTIPDIVYMVDQAGVFVYLNESIRQIGYTPQELLGKHFSAILLADDVAQVSRDTVLPRFTGKITGDEQAPKLFDERRAGTRRTRDLEVRVIAKSGVPQEGDIFYSLVCASGFYDVNGGSRHAFLGTIGVMRDITHRKRFEEELRRREAFNFALFEHNPIETVVVDREGRVTKFNLAKRRAGDRLPVIGDVMYRDYARKHEIDMHRELMACMRNGVPKEFPEMRYGEKILSISISPFAHGAIITSQNITRRRLAEERLRESEQRFRETADLLPAVVCEFDPALKITYVNRAGLDLFGYTAEDLQRGLSLFQILHPDDREKARARTAEVLRGRRSEPAEYRALTKDGSEMLLLVNSSPILRQGEVVGLRTSAMNITYRREMEKEIQKAQILESLGVLAGGIGHDFNNILAGIYGNAQLAQKKLRKGEEVMPYLEGIEKATERAVSLSRQLLTFAKGGAPIRRVTTLQDLLRETAVFALRGSHVNCTFDIAADLWPCSIDPGQIGQVMNNLVLNAGQAMPQGGTVAIAADNVRVGPATGIPLREGRYVRVRVTDTGVGIPDEHLHRIFEPYFTTKQKGSGLGLTVSYSIVVKHDGYITATSSLGRGTTFAVYLPAVEQDVPQQHDDAGHSPAGKGRVLLMDDDDIVRQVGGEVLKDLGYQVTTVPSGGEAVEEYQKALRSGQPFAAVILDLTVPGGMGGKETVQRLHSIEPGVVALVSSGYSDDPVMARPAEYGFAGVISKPYDIDEMGRVLRHALQRKNA